MITTDLRLALRPPAWTRVLVVLSAAVVPFYVRFGIDPVRGDRSWLVAAGAFLVTAVLTWRLARLAALGAADGWMVVRNYRRDRTVHRGDVDRVVIDVARIGWSVQLELVDGFRCPAGRDRDTVPPTVRRTTRAAGRGRSLLGGGSAPAVRLRPATQRAAVRFLRSQAFRSEPTLRHALGRSTDI